MSDILATYWPYLLAAAALALLAVLALCRVAGDADDRAEALAARSLWMEADDAD